MCSLVLVVLLIGFASPVVAEDYFPICVGSVWEYVSLNLAVDYATECIGTEVVWGIECAVFANHSYGDEGLLQFWYKGEDGAAFIRGFYRKVEGWGLLYDPGIQVVSEAPFLGEEWCGTVDVYNLPDTTYTDTFPYCWFVEEEGSLELPAGTFYAYGVAWAAPEIRCGGYDLFGRKCALFGRDPGQWYSESFGRVQFGTTEVFQLANYSLPPSFAEDTSWGRVKLLYRTDLRR